jgi:hypothetical protein
MKVKQCLCVVAITILIAGCGSAERKANKSVAEVNKERLSLIEDYQKCVKKAGDDQAKAEACETYRKSAEALQ